MGFFYSVVRAHVHPMSPAATDITIRPQKGTWMFVFVPFLVAVFASEMVLQRINPFWWVPPLILISLVMLVPFRDPFAIVFRGSSRTMEVRYRIGRRPRIYSFDDLDFIQSFIRVSGEADTYVQLEVRLKNGKRIPLISENAAWDSSAPLFSLSGAREPQDITNLRRQISSSTGIRDLGFC